MTRFLLSLALALVAVVVLAGAVALLAYGGEPKRNGTLRLEGLTAEVTLAWTEAGEVTIEADDEVALWTGLGYAHAADQGWAMALWRQAALGELSVWIGPDALDLDRHARRLGFGALARQSYARLPADDRAAVDAYARGVQLAFRDEAVSQRDEFVELDVEAATWEPWHALAVERLVAWLGTEPLPTRGGPPAANAFALSDSLFRDALALGGLSHARAYVAPASWPSDGRTPTLVYHQPYGSSTLPLLTGARLRLRERDLVVATIPGTLLLPAGSGAWATFLTSDRSLSRDTVATPDPVYSRLADRSGRETLLEVLRDSTGLLLSVNTAVPRDTLDFDSETEAPILAPRERDALSVRLRWQGLRLGSDVGSFRALFLGRAPRFTLFRGDGLQLASGAVVPLGAPPVLADGVGWWFATSPEAGALASARIAALVADSSLRADALALDVGSPWALTETQRMIRSLGPRDSLARDLQDAYAFLRGWDGLFAPEAIAPTIAESWSEVHCQVFGRAPDPTQRLDSALVTYTFRLGLARLRDSLGTAPGRWTWDRLAGKLRQPLLEDHDPNAPVYALAGGHPTSPLPGTSLILDAPPGPAVFSFWTNGQQARTDHPSLPVTRANGRDLRVVRTWPSPDPDRPTLRILPS